MDPISSSVLFACVGANPQSSVDLNAVGPSAYMTSLGTISEDSGSRKDIDLGMS